MLGSTRLPGLVLLVNPFLNHFGLTNLTVLMNLCYLASGADDPGLRPTGVSNSSAPTRGTRPGYFGWWSNTTEASRRAGGYSSLLRNFNRNYENF